MSIEELREAYRLARETHTEAEKAWLETIKAQDKAYKVVDVTRIAKYNADQDIDGSAYTEDAYLNALKAYDEAEKAHDEAKNVREEAAETYRAANATYGEAKAAYLAALNKETE